MLRSLLNSGFFSYFPLALAATIYPLSLSARGSELNASDGEAQDRFGFSVSLSGSMGLVGAYNDTLGAQSQQGSAYVFRQVDASSEEMTENTKLTASGISSDSLVSFGRTVSVSGDNALIGAPFEDIGAKGSQGSAYVFRGIGAAAESLTQNVRLTASNGVADDSFGSGLSLAGGMALVMAPGANAAKGAIYGFRGLNTATGTVRENFTLARPDISRTFMPTVSLSGTSALVVAVAPNGGDAYLYRNLDSATGVVTHNLTLSRSDSGPSNGFGTDVSLSGNMALVGAAAANSNRGSVYVFRNLDRAFGTVTENLKLIASDGVDGDRFGISLSLSGNTALVAALRYLSTENGSVYLFRNLDTASGTVSQNVKIMHSQSSIYENFACSLSLDGDNFLIGAHGGTGRVEVSGIAVSGTVSSLTTLDAGNATRVIQGLSFVSQDDWIIGAATDNNKVTLSKGDSATVTAAGKGVFVGKNTGAQGNVLSIHGQLTANSVEVAGSGSRLEVNGGVITTGGVILRSGATLSGSGSVTGPVVLESGAAISPGNSAGAILTGSQTWNGGGVYLWQVNADTGTAGTDWDLIRSEGQLNIAATSSDPFFIRIEGTAAGLEGPESHDWTIVTAAGGFGGTFSSDKFSLDAAGFTGGTQGDFSIVSSGNSLLLRFTAVPEPHGAALLLMSLVFAIRRGDRVGL